MVLKKKSQKNQKQSFYQKIRNQGCKNQHLAKALGFAMLEQLQLRIIQLQINRWLVQINMMSTIKIFSKYYNSPKNNNKDFSISKSQNIMRMIGLLKLVNCQILKSLVNKPFLMILIANPQLKLSKIVILPHF